MEIDDQTESLLFARAHSCPPPPPPNLEDKKRVFHATLEKRTLTTEDPEELRQIIAISEYLSETTSERNSLLRDVGIDPPKKESRLTRLVRRQVQGVHELDIFERNIRLRRAISKLLETLNVPPDEKLSNLAVTDVIALSIIVFAIEHGIPNLSLATTLFGRLLLHGYTIGAHQYADCRFGDYSGVQNLLTHSLPIDVKYVDAIVLLLNHFDHIDRSDLKKMSESKETYKRIAWWLNNLEFTTERSFEKCALDFNRLLESEICLATPPPLRHTFSGKATIAALTMEQRARLHHSTLRVPETVNDLEIDEECRRAVGSDSIHAADEKNNNSPIKLSGEARRDLTAIIGVADEKAGKNAPVFRRFLGGFVTEYLNQAEKGLALWDYLSAQYLIEISERGTRQSAENPERGVASTIRTYFQIVYAFLASVYTDDEVLDNATLAISRTSTYLKTLGDKRAAAEQPIDYALELLCETHDIERPPPYVIYGAKAPPLLARNYIANHATYSSVLAIAYREPDPNLRFRYVLSLLLMYRAGLRIGETHVIQLQSLSVELGYQGTDKACTTAALTVHVRRRGRWRPKSRAGNRTLTLHLSNITTEESKTLEKLLRMQQRATDRTSYIFSSGRVRQDSVTDNTIANQLRALMKWVTSDPEATLHGFGRRSCINAFLACAFGTTPKLAALNTLLCPSRLGRRNIPLSIAHGGMRHTHFPRAMCSLFGHSSFTDTTLGQYGVHQSEFYLEYWQRREVLSLAKSFSGWMRRIHDYA
ncbi:hypothetical protein NOR53_2581 [gamma proteobacterium NOR5-3]|nr:hypothetical protein NOR53_2581 [gamma proteobacterium NOR5-3]